MKHQLLQQLVSLWHAEHARPQRAHVRANSHRARDEQVSRFGFTNAFSLHITAAHSRVAIDVLDRATVFAFEFEQTRLGH